MPGALTFVGRGHLVLKRLESAQSGFYLEGEGESFAGFKAEKRLGPFSVNIIWQGCSVRVRA